MTTLFDQARESEKELLDHRACKLQEQLEKNRGKLRLYAKEQRLLKKQLTICHRLRRAIKEMPEKSPFHHKESKAEYEERTKTPEGRATSSR